MCMQTEGYINALIERDKAKKVKWETAGCIGRICPTCGHISYYCGSGNGQSLKQPDNFCSKCGQRFVVE